MSIEPVRNGFTHAMMPRVTNAITIDDSTAKAGFRRLASHLRAEMMSHPTPRQLQRTVAGLLDYAGDLRGNIHAPEGSVLRRLMYVAELAGTTIARLDGDVRLSVPAIVQHDPGAPDEPVDEPREPSLDLTLVLLADLEQFAEGDEGTWEAAHVNAVLLTELRNHPSLRGFTDAEQPHGWQLSVDDPLAIHLLEYAAQIGREGHLGPHEIGWCGRLADAMVYAGAVYTDPHERVHPVNAWMAARHQLHNAGVEGAGQQIAKTAAESAHASASFYGIAKLM